MKDLALIGVLPMKLAKIAFHFYIYLNVKLIDGKLETDLHIKPIDRHQYLHYLSSHPEHTKRSVVHSQNIRVDRLGSLEKNFNYHKLNTKEWFFKRGYPESVI